MDHPSKKAVFDIALEIDPHLTAISNGNILKEVLLETGKKRVIFEPTPKMSTYLVFFGVGEFDITADEIDPRVRVVTLPGMKAHAGYGLDVREKGPCIFRIILRRGLSPIQNGSDRHSGFCLRRHGKLGRHYVSGKSAAALPGNDIQSRRGAESARSLPMRSPTSGSGIW